MTSMAVAKAIAWQSAFVGLWLSMTAACSNEQSQEENEPQACVSEVPCLDAVLDGDVADPAFNSNVCTAKCSTSQHCEFQLKSCDSGHCRIVPTCSNRLMNPCSITMCTHFCAVRADGRSVCVPKPE
jgi:hypothetical protein